MSAKVVIVDYGLGNLSSVARGLERARADFLVSSDASDIEHSSKLILAGVGHFGRAMAALRERGLLGSLETSVLRDRKPVLGICLGMELMARSSEEGNVAGLGWLDAEAVRFNISDRLKHKVPHIAWNRVRVAKNSRLMNGIPDAAEFYFLHSYYLKVADETVTVSESSHETVFPAVVEKNNIFGVQFHPEKSREAGLKVLRNFVELS